MKRVWYKLLAGVMILSILLCAAGAGAGVPSVSDVLVADVTTRSFAVIWSVSEPAVPDILVFEDAAGSVPAAGASIHVHPVRSGDVYVKAAAEENGVMKVEISGLFPGSTYYFQLVTTSTATDDVDYHPDGAPFPGVTTEIRTVRSEVVDSAETPFSNDLIVDAIYLADQVTPAEGTLLVAEISGSEHPVSGYVGDGVDLPYAVVDLNQLFETSSHETMEARGGEEMVLTHFKGLLGKSSFSYYVPENSGFAEMKHPSTTKPCSWDSGSDGDVDGGDVAEAVSGAVMTSEELSSLAAEFGCVHCTLPPMNL